MLMIMMTMMRRIMGKWMMQMVDENDGKDGDENRGGDDITLKNGLVKRFDQFQCAYKPDPRAFFPRTCLESFCAYLQNYP